VSSGCRICLKATRNEEDYHARCLRGLFGTGKVPTLDIELSKLHTAALAMVGRSSLSGVQKKISVNLTANRETLQVAAAGGRYILKPQTEAFPSLPENEHITTILAREAGISVPQSGVVPLGDGSLAYVAKRFDRLDDGRKLRQEDFCQLAEKSPKEKYDGSAELCMRLLRRYATEPLIESLKLYRLLVFAWWSGNGDMHLKNFSLLVDPQGTVRLTPAYDLVSTRLVIPEDQLALPVAGKRENLTRKTWLEFADYCEIPEKTALRVLETQAAMARDAEAMIDASFLPGDQKDALKALLSTRSATLIGR
jgi:serine/threonine-protein kinase HipA